MKHNSSWRVLKGDRQVTHPHPSFSPDNKYVLYSCDAEGEPALYMAKGDIKKLKFESFYDSESNNEVIRLTPTDIPVSYTHLRPVPARAEVCIY